MTYPSPVERGAVELLVATAALSALFTLSRPSIVRAASSIAGFLLGACMLFVIAVFAVFAMLALGVFLLASLICEPILARRSV